MNISRTVLDKIPLDTAFYRGTSDLDIRPNPVRAHLAVPPSLQLLLNNAESKTLELLHHIFNLWLLE